MALWQLFVVFILALTTPIRTLTLIPEYGVITQQIGTLSMEPKGSLLFRIQEPPLPPGIDLDRPCPIAVTQDSLSLTGKNKLLISPTIP